MPIRPLSSAGDGAGRPARCPQSRGNFTAVGVPSPFEVPARPGLPRIARGPVSATLRPDLPRERSDAVPGVPRDGRAVASKDVSYLLEQGGAWPPAAEELEARVTWRTIGVHRGHAGEPRATRRPRHGPLQPSRSWLASAVSVGTAVVVRPPAPSRHRRCRRPALPAPAALRSPPMPAPSPSAVATRPGRQQPGHAAAAPPGAFGGGFRSGAARGDGAQRPRAFARGHRRSRPRGRPPDDVSPRPPPVLPSPPCRAAMRPGRRSQTISPPLLKRGAGVLVDVRRRLPAATTGHVSLAHGRP